MNIITTSIFLFFGVLLFFVAMRLGRKSVYLLISFVLFFDYIIRLFITISSGESLSMDGTLSLYREIIILSLFIVYIKSHYRNNIPFRKLVPWFYLAIFSYLISWAVNNQSAIVALFSLRYYFAYIIVFYLVVKLIPNEKYLFKLFSFISNIFMIQIPVGIMQYFIFQRADFIGGTFGKHASGPISLLGISFIFLFHYLYKYYSPKNIYKFAMYGTILVLIMSESKLAIILIPLSYLVSIKIQKQVVHGGIKFLLLGFPLLILFLNLFDYVQNTKGYNYNLTDSVINNPVDWIKWSTTRKIELDYSLEEIQRLSYSAEDRYHNYLSRTESIYYIFRLLKKEPMKLAFGYGPGEAHISSVHKGIVSEIGFYRHYLTYLLLEFGIFGASIWLSFILYIMVINYRTISLLKKIKVNSMWTVLIYYTNILNFIMIVGFIYNNSIINYYIGLIFWVFNAFLFWFSHHGNRLANNSSVSKII